MSGVGLLVGESRVGFVDSSQRERIGGFETTKLVLLIEVSVAHIATEVEEDDFDFLALALGHGVHDILVGVLPASGDVDGLLAGLVPFDCGAARDQVADRLHTGAEDRKHFAGELILAENRLHSLDVELSGVLLQKRAVVGDSLVDLSCGRSLGGWGHDLCHGVIPFFGKEGCLGLPKVTVIAIKYQFLNILWL